MSKEVTIGIDLGTSNSCVATVLEGEPTVLANAAGERTTASVVAFHDDGKILVGNQAKAEVILDPQHTVSSAKRLIGRYYFSEEVRKARAICRYEIESGDNHSVHIRIREEKFSLSEISAFVLKEIKQIAEQRLGCEVTGAVITVPAYFNDNQRQATKDAGRIAGLNVMRILNEPTAAALAYGYGRDLNQKVVVYDLGGGTFDVSVLEIGSDVFEVLSTCGDTYLGGDDFDDRVIDLLAEKMQAEQGVNPRSDPKAFERLRQGAEQLKIGLSTEETSRIVLDDLIEVDGKKLSLEHELTRKEFSKLTRDLIQRTFKVCDEALQEAGLTTRDLDGVILVGGPTRLPTIRNAVKEYFQKEPETNINPDEVVAVGAAIHASSLASSTTSSDTFLLDVTPLTLRIGIAGGLTQPIIDRNSPVPIDHTRTFTTAQDFQESIAVRVYQGESKGEDGNALLAEFEFADFQPGPRDQVRIEVTFAINTEGIVKVSARDPRTGQETSTTVAMSSGLSEQEIQAILEKSRADDVATPEISDGGVGLQVDASDDDDELLDDSELDAIVDDISQPDLGTPEDADRELFGAVEGPLGGGPEIEPAPDAGAPPEPAAQPASEAPPEIVPEGGGNPAFGLGSAREVDLDDGAERPIELDAPPKDEPLIEAGDDLLLDPDDES